jgi:HTH-type transcriptional regulator/antitoxin HigA
VNDYFAFLLICLLTDSDLAAMLLLTRPEGKGSMVEGKSAEVPVPGRIIREKLEERNWSQSELADIMGRSDTDVSEFISGKRSISLEVAKELAVVFGTDPEYWMDLEARYQLSRGKDADERIARRAKLYQFAPIREMMKRRWLAPSDDIGTLETRVAQYFGVATLDEPISVPHAARKATTSISPPEWAWIFRAGRLASAAPCTGSFSNQSFRRALSELKRLLPSSQEARQVPTILSEAGIRFLVIEHLPQTSIDGVTLWLNAKSPVIALSMRYDRIDCFWYTLAHELGHIARRDGTTRVMLDTGIVGENAETAHNSTEQEADDFATDFLVGRANLDSFIARIRPLYGRQRILGFAKRIGVHPGIVVGQLQFRKEIGWSSFRPMLEKVRSIVTQSALTDGWGHLAPLVS